MRYIISTLILFVALPHYLFGQNLINSLNNPAEQIIERLDIKNGGVNFHTSIKPYLRADLTQVKDSLKYYSPLTPIEQFDLFYLDIDNNEFLSADVNESVESKKAFVDSTKTFFTMQDDLRLSDEGYNIQSRKPFLKHFYRTPAHFWEVDVEDFYLKVSPILHFAYGDMKYDEGALFTNKRGLEVRGGVDRKVYFYSQIVESQERFPNYVNQFTDKAKAVPGAGFYKNYNSDIFNVKRGRDFLLARGYVGVNISKHVGLQLGHGENFIGDGYRSLLLSDFSAPYFYLKLNTRVWKFHYQNLFAELASNGTRDFPGDTRIGRKYLAGHYLSFNIRKNLSIGIYEAVIFNRGRNRFELQYLNPIIFYRTIEGMIGSPDNAMLGMTFKWNLWNTASIYGQLMVDDISIGDIMDGNIGAFPNKLGFQAGIKYIDAFKINNLDIQVEVNHVRPYSYSHRDSTASYTHFNQAIAHPLGANFREVILRAKYRPLKRLALEANLFLIETGEGNDTLNVGTNILQTNSSAQGSENNIIGQGNPVDLNYLQLQASYQLSHNLFIDLEFGRRNRTTGSGENDLKTQYIQGGVRLNFHKSKSIF